MNSFTTLTARLVVMPVNNIDTDQIIPARFLKTTDKMGLGSNLFSDWRYLADGAPNPDFILNKPESQGAQILLAGDNFGCGSSREHAPWALAGWGFRVVISTGIADIFRNNSLKNGLLPVVVDNAQYQALMAHFSRTPEKQLTVDLEHQLLILPDEDTIEFAIDGFSKTCLLNGTDELGYLLGMETQIATYEHTVDPI
jgi:3-isopropylmalate/(R)-2-methylmalate dehydratase small subunit